MKKMIALFLLALLLCGCSVSIPASVAVEKETEPVDPMSDEAKESIRSALKLGLEAAKLKNKQIYTPKKYRKG